MQSDTAIPPESRPKSTVAFFLSADSFEGFYGGIFGLDRETFLASYRNDFVWEYAEGLRRNGHEVVLYLLSYGKPERRSIRDGLSVRFLPLPWWLRLVDPFTYRLQGVPRLRTLRERARFLAYGKALHQALRDDGVTVMYHQEIWTPRFDLIVQYVRVPVVGAEHGASFEPWMEPAKRAILPHAASLTCQSVATLELARRFGGTAELFYNGIDTALYVPPPAEQAREPKTILTVGRLVEEQKRFTDLLQAVRRLEGYTLLLVGSGPAESALRHTARKLGIADRVQFLGFISDRERLRQLYQRSTVFVSTSAWEAVALVVLEAMSCETPVVCTQIPSFRELLKDGEDGLLVPVGDPDAVATAVKRAVAQAATLGPAARQTVKARYSADALYRRLADLLFAVGTAVPPHEEAS